jgi:hypothetical protein
MRSALFLVFILAFTGCTTERAILTNAQGEELTCETRGYGFFGSVSVRNQVQQCIAEAEKRGYRLR